MSATPTPYKQIRAHYDTSTITVYQAYTTTIASAAVAAQKLNASPQFRTNSRMTWIKPSWAWMLYRAGYSYKDPGQARILALKMRHADFINLLSSAVLTSHSPPNPTTTPDSEPSSSSTGKSTSVKVQWDPERSIRLEKLPHRSIQIGIPGSLTEHWVENLIVGIEDVTDKARELKRVLDEKGEDVMMDELIEMGLVPLEREFEVPERVKMGLGMVLRSEADTVPRETV